jgi:flagellar biosynthesis component FlhA
VAGKEAIKHLGIELLEPYEFLVLEAYGAAFEAIDEFFGLDEAMQMVERLRFDHGALIEEVLDGKVLSAGEFAEVLRRLVRERVSIRDIKLILEGIAEFQSLSGEIPDRTDWLGELHSFLRVVLSRAIVGEALSPSGSLRAFVLSQPLEDEFREAMSLWDGFRSQPPIDPRTKLSLKAAAQRMFQPVLERGSVPIIVLCPAEIRLAVQEFFGSQVLNPDCFRAIAYEELGSRCRTEPVGVLRVDN